MALTKRNSLIYEGTTMLNQVIPIIQNCSDDKEASVRYRAREALFNVIDSAKEHIIPFFDIIFRQIQSLSDDENELVRESNKLVNIKLQAIVCSCDDFKITIVCSSDDFKIKPFINTLESLIRNKSHRIRILALGWLIALDAQPDIYLLAHLHHLIKPLFSLIMTNNQDLEERKLLDHIMADFLTEISEYLQRNPSDIHALEKMNINLIVDDLIQIIMSPSNALQTAVGLKWLDTYIIFADETLNKLYPSLLQAILFSMNTQKVQAIASTVSKHLLLLILTLDQINKNRLILADEDMKNNNNEDIKCSKCYYDTFETTLMINILISTIKNNQYSRCARIDALQWISVLLDELPAHYIPFAQLSDINWELFIAETTTTKHLQAEIVSTVPVRQCILETNIIQFYGKEEYFTLTCKNSTITKSRAIFVATYKQFLRCNVIINGQYLYLIPPNIYRKWKLFASKSKINLIIQEKQYRLQQHTENGEYILNNECIVEMLSNFGSSNFELVHKCVSIFSNKTIPITAT
eukprot:209745_1